MLSADALVLDGRFRILRLIGNGGMGDVYLAEQVSLGRPVAIKVLKPELSLQPGMSDRFKREARLLSSVDHPAVVRVIDFGQSEGASCLVMEYAEGPDLHAALASGPLPQERAVPLLIQLAEGLAAIHARGIVHRDLKPENVVLSRGPRGEQARWLDFGVARLAEPDHPANAMTQAGLVLGTPEYVSPEQAMGLALDARSDLYSLGVLAFRILAGVLPFPGPTPRQYLSQHVQAAPTSLAVAAPWLAAQPVLCELVMRCLEKEREARPATAAAVIDTLAGIGPTSVSAATASRPPLAPVAEVNVPKRSEPGRLDELGAVESHREPRFTPTALESVGVPGWVASLSVAASSVEPTADPLAVELPGPLAGAVTPGAAAGADGLRGLVVRGLVVRGLVERLRGRSGWFAAVAAGTVALLVLVAFARAGSTLQDVRAQVEAGELTEALASLERAERRGADRQAVLLLKAAALHRADRHREELSALQAAGRQAVASADPWLLAGALEDFSRREEASRTVLEWVPQSRLRELARQAFSWPQWGALRYLDLSRAVSADELVVRYATALQAKDCTVRALAARRLGELGETEAIAALKALAEAPRAPSECGHDAARWALRELERRRGR